MKVTKFLTSVLFVAALAVGFTSCDDKDKDNGVNDPFNQGGNGTENNGGNNGGTGGSGNATSSTKEAPFTVADAIANQNEKYEWVKGFIVGFVSGQSISGATFSTESASETNILIASSASETDANNCLPVQLPPGAIRDGLNLNANAGNLGKEVLLYGQLTKYFGVAGLKNVSFAEIEGAAVGTDPSLQSESITIARALEIIAGLEEGGQTTVNYIITGTVSEITTSEANIAQYKNCDFNMTDGENTIKAFRTKGFNKANFTSGLISVGDEVKVEGPLMRYVKDDGTEIPEIAYGWLVE